MISKIEKKNSFNYLFMLLFIVSTIISLLAKIYPYFLFDIFISRNIQSFYSPLFDLTMKLLSFFGNPIPGFIILISISVFLISKRKVKEAFFILSSTCGAVILSTILKVLIHRPRPTSDLVLQTKQFTGFDSFPSGHVIFFVVLFGFLFYLTSLIIHNKKTRNKLLILFSALIFLIGISRIYLGAHWFSDVIGAYLIGFLWLLFTINLYKK